MPVTVVLPCGPGSPEVPLIPTPSPPLSPLSPFTPASPAEKTHVQIHPVVGRRNCLDPWTSTLNYRRANMRTLQTERLYEHLCFSRVCESLIGQLWDCITVKHLHPDNTQTSLNVLYLENKSCLAARSCLPKGSIKR